MKTIAIIGTGAVGGYCAAKLHQAGFDVHCLLGHDYGKVRENGLTLIENNRDIISTVKAYKDSSQIPRCDIIVVALKSTSNFILEKLLSSLLSPNGLVVILQNGIGVEEEVAKFVEPEKIVGGSCILKVTKISPGVVKHFGYNMIELAQYYIDNQYEGISEAVENLSRIFKKSGIDAQPAPHLPTIRWKKLCGNIPTSGLSVVLNASAKDLVENPASFSLVKLLTQEVIVAARKSGAHIPDEFYEFREKILESFRTMEKHNMSMKDDFDTKKPLELHAIYENALNIAERHGALMPLTKMLYQQLLYLDAKNQVSQKCL